MIYKSNLLNVGFIFIIVILIINSWGCKKGASKREIPSVHWSASSNYRSEVVTYAFDGDIKTRWDTGVNQTPGMYFELNLGEPYRVSEIILYLGNSIHDYPRILKIDTSLDLKNWSTLIDNIVPQPKEGKITISFEPKPMQGIRLIQLGKDQQFWWSIHEIKVLELLE
jgi:hypothetical protein